MMRSGQMKIAGLPVIDATKDIILTITANDIRAGKGSDPASCAAAQACMRQLHASAALVHLGRTYIKMGKHWLRYTTPGSIRSEVIAFDRRRSFKPGDYLLRPAKPTGKMQGSKTNQTRKNGKAKGKREKLPRHFIEGIRASAHEYGK